MTTQYLVHKYILSLFILYVSPHFNVIIIRRAVVYNAMDSSEKEAYCAKNRTNMKHKYQVKKNENQNQKIKTSSDNVMLDCCISKFHSRIKEGLYYICSVCNRLLYRKSVKLLEMKKYSLVPKTLFINIASFDKKQYICTCHSKVVKSKIPCQAVYNDMSVDEVLLNLHF